MALRRLVSKRFHGSHRPNPSSPPLDSTFRRHLYLPPPPHSGEKSVLRRFLQRRAIYHSPAAAQIRLDGLALPPSLLLDRECSVSGCAISIDDARKIMRFSQIEKLKAKLRDIPASSISYSEFVQICVEDCGSDELVKVLDESGIVIVVGNVVFLRPDQVAKSMETMISNSIATPNDPRFKQLAEMENQKAIIDKKAQAQVRAELYYGLGLLLGQTLGFMRLTFWELSWDVMEPICFFASSLYVPLAFSFFLSTSTEPSFEGFFRRRFEAKQRKLMASHNFDIDSYNELKRICYPFPRNPNHGVLFSYTIND